MQLAIPVSSLLPLIPLSARAVLHVGCGNGELAAAYRQLNPKARLLGIEPDALAAARAATHLHQVSVTDGQADPLPFDLSSSIDCIVYNDISQHLQDPWTMIQRHAEVLSPDGVMLICVPNVEYWRLTEQRLRGGCYGGEANWQHHRHAASFSMAGIREQARRAGLTLCDITPWEPDRRIRQVVFRCASIRVVRAWHRCGRLCSPGGCQPLDLPGAQGAGAADDPVREHVGAGRWGFACARGASAAGGGNRSGCHHGGDRPGGHARQSADGVRASSCCTAPSLAGEPA